MKNSILISLFVVISGLFPAVAANPSGDRKVPADSLSIVVKQASAGNPVCMNTVGLWYYNGENYTRNYKKAFEWFKAAAKKGNPQAMYNLGRCLRFGQGVRRDSVKALTQYLLAAKSGNTNVNDYCEEMSSQAPFEAIVAANCHERAINTPADLSKAANLYAKAAALGSVDAAKKAGYCNYILGNGPVALNFYADAADRGDADAACNAGRLLLGAQGAPADINQAIEYLRQGADADISQAVCELGKLNAAGIGMPKNAVAAAEHYARAAAMPHPSPEAFMLYGQALAEGSGIAPAHDLALYWMLRYALSSDDASARLSGYLKSLKKNNQFLAYVKGVRRLAVDHNPAAAQKELKKDKNAAAKVMQLAAVASPRYSKADLDKLQSNLRKLIPDGDSGLYPLAAKRLADIGLSGLIPLSNLPSVSANQALAKLRF